MENNAGYHVLTDEEVAAIAKKCVADAEAAVKARSAPRDSTEDPPPREATPGEIFAGVAMLAGAVVLIAWGINHYSAQAVAAETARAVTNTGGIIFQCVSEPQASWQLLTHLNPSGDILKTAAEQVSRLPGDLAAISGKIYQEGKDQLFHLVYQFQPVKGASTLIPDVQNVCPAEMIVR